VRDYRSSQVPAFGPGLAVLVDAGALAAVDEAMGRRLRAGHVQATWHARGFVIRGRPPRNAKVTAVYRY
jgi:hypothetical protein